MREEVLEEIRATPGPRKPFSLVVFLILLIVFWPAAVGYAMWKGGILDPMLEKLGMSTHGAGGARS